MGLPCAAFTIWISEIWRRSTSSASGRIWTGKEPYSDRSCKWHMKGSTGWPSGVWYLRLERYEGHSLSFWSRHDFESTCAFFLLASNRAGRERRRGSFSVLRSTNDMGRRQRLTCGRKRRWTIFRMSLSKNDCLVDRWTVQQKNIWLKSAQKRVERMTDRFSSYSLQDSWYWIAALVP